MSSSFISEHSAEYILVPDLAGRLQKHYTHVIPFFFWASREGASMARASDWGPVRILAAYARRPKIEAPGQPSIRVKINKALFDHAQRLQELGVPVLSGVPLVSNFADLQVGAPCAWFSINSVFPWRSDYEFDLPLTDHPEAHTAGRGVEGPLSTEAILQVVRLQSRPMGWSEALDSIHKARRELFSAERPYLPWWGRMATYKPFYVALTE